jgi:hypothetical protein
MNDESFLTKSEIRQLIVAVANNGEDWWKVAKILGRTPEICHDEYMTLSTFCPPMNIFIHEKDLEKADVVTSINDKINIFVIGGNIAETEIIEKTESLNNNGFEKLSNLINVLNDFISNEEDNNKHEIILNSNDASQSKLTLNKRKRFDHEIINIKYAKTKQLEYPYWSMEILNFFNQFESIDEKLQEKDWKQISKLFTGRRSEQSCKLKFFHNEEFYWNKHLEFVQNTDHINVTNNNDNNDNNNDSNNDNNSSNDEEMVTD